MSSGRSPEDMLDGRGLVLVRALTKGWGVFQSRNYGKTVWAVLDIHAVAARPMQGSQAHPESRNDAGARRRPTSAC